MFDSLVNYAWNGRRCPFFPCRSKRLMISWYLMVQWIFTGNHADFPMNYGVFRLTCSLKPIHWMDLNGWYLWWLIVFLKNLIASSWDIPHSWNTPFFHVNEVSTKRAWSRQTPFSTKILSNSCRVTRLFLTIKNRHFDHQKWGGTS